MILVADVNEHIIDGKLPAELKRIDMMDVFPKKLNLPRPASHVTGSELIDSALVASDLVSKEVSIYPAKFRVGNYRVILINLDFNRIIERGA